MPDTTSDEKSNSKPKGRRGDLIAGIRSRNGKLVMQSNVSYYQRLLAGDEDEAEEIVEEYLQTHPVEQVYDDIFIPALNDVKRDFALGKLEENNQHHVYGATRNILEELNG